jgi:acetate---CoA ligase (ADP-forming)
VNRAQRVGRMLDPRSVAIVGASADVTKFSGQIIPTLVGSTYEGRVYAVNPKYEEIGGVPCYPSIGALPEAVDHCVILLSRQHAEAALAECAALGVASASVFASGYGELGVDGRAAQESLRSAAGEMVFLGPNCMGLANLTSGIHLTTSAVLDHGVQAGDIALLSQSGGLSFASIFYFATEADLRFSRIVNTGNTAGISFADLVKDSFDDPSTQRLLLVAESDSVVAQAIEVVRREGLRKPIVLLKLGRGETGSEMARSHTGSLAADYGLVRDVAEQHGIVCVDDIDEAVGVLALLGAGATPDGLTSLAAASISGGNVTLLADVVDASPLSFAPLSDVTTAMLRASLPDYITIHNPIDITALGYERPEIHLDVLRALQADPGVGVVIPILTTVADYSDVCRMIAETTGESRHPLVVLWNGGSYEDESALILRVAGIPVFRSANLFVRCGERIVRAASDDTTGDSRSTALHPDDVAGRAPDASLLDVHGALTESASFALLASAGISVPDVRVVPPADVEEACRAVGYPVVLKVDSATTHLSDGGGVVVDVRGPEEVAAALTGPLGAAARILVARYVPGAEAIASVFPHPDLGAMLMVGSGGRLAELLADVRFVTADASRAVIAAAFRSTHIGRALAENFRGMTGFEEAVDLLVRLAALGRDVCTTRDLQIEINPFTVGSHGAIAVDASVMSVTDDGQHTARPGTQRPTP